MNKVRVLLPLLVVGGIGLAGCAPRPLPPPPPPPPPLVIVDTLAGLDTNTKFSVSTAGGQTIQQDFQATGPQFVLTRTTRLTQVGAWVNNCRSITAGVPDCPNTKPIIVQIHPDKNGVPDPARVLATIELSHDNDPLTVTFESARTHLSLLAGTYYAFFTTQQPEDSGYILAAAQVPFVYQSGLAPFGYVTSSQPPFTTITFGAVRILGTT
jgi:hypothetical protein